MLTTDHRQPTTATRGFTLIELMVVMAIIAILSAAVAPAMGGFLKSSQTRSLLRRISSQFLYAREYAVGRGLLTRVECDRNAGTLSLAVEPDPANNPGVFQPVRVHGVGLVVLPEEAGFADLQINGEDPSTAGTIGRSDSQPSIYFYPDGHTDAASLTMKMRDRRYEIDLAPLTGRVQLKDVTDAFRR